jgi:hypothetical protein
MYCDIAKTWVNASVSPPRPSPMCFVFKTKVMFSSGSKHNRESSENLPHGSQKNLAQNVNTFAFLSCQIFVVDHSKTSSFFAFKTCCEILLCNSIAIIHYF